MSREDSTVAIDNVDLIEAPETEIEPFRPGYPLVRVTRRVTLPFGLALRSAHRPARRLRTGGAISPANGPYPGLPLLESGVEPSHRSPRTVHRNPLLPWSHGPAPESFPILTVRGPAPLDVPEDILEPYLRAWALELASWGYPALAPPLARHGTPASLRFGPPLHRLLAQSAGLVRCRRRGERLLVLDPHHPMRRGRSILSRRRTR